MFGSNFRDFVSQDTTSQGQSNSERLIKSWHGFEKPDSEDSGIEEEFEVLDSESQEIPATPCSTPPEDLRACPQTIKFKHIPSLTSIYS